MTDQNEIEKRDDQETDFLEHIPKPENEEEDAEVVSVPPKNVESDASEKPVEDRRPTFRSAESKTQRVKKPQLEPKENRAFILTCGCLIGLVAIWVIDLLWGNKELSDKVIDLFKYVIIASLGFFFGTSRNESEKNSKDNDWKK